MVRFNIKIPRIPVPDEKDILKKVAVGLFQGAEEIAGAARQEHVPVNDGILRNTIEATLPSYEGNRVEVTVFAGGPAARYALFVHEGTLPHWAPIEPLKRWAKKVLGDENAAYAVQRKIAQVGTKPTKYIEIPFLRLKPTIVRRVQRAVRRIARNK